jgi:hypothetical protein
MLKHRRSRFEIAIAQRLAQGKTKCLADTASDTEFLPNDTEYGKIWDAHRHRSMKKPRVLRGF